MKRMTVDLYAATDDDGQTHHGISEKTEVDLARPRDRSPRRDNDPQGATRLDIPSSPHPSLLPPHNVTMRN